VRGTGRASGCRCNPGARCAIEVSAAGDGATVAAPKLAAVAAARSVRQANGGRKCLLTMDLQEGILERMVCRGLARFEFKLVVLYRHGDNPRKWFPALTAPRVNPKARRIVATVNLRSSPPEMV